MATAFELAQREARRLRRETGRAHVVVIDGSTAPTAADDASVPARLRPPADRRQDAVRAAERAIYDWLDDEAQALDYRDWDEAAGYASGTHAVFGPEGRAFVAWGGAVWEAWFALKETWRTTPPPLSSLTWDSIKAQLPAFPGVTPARPSWYDKLLRFVGAR